MTPPHARSGLLGAFLHDIRRRTEPPNRVIRLIIAYKAVAAFLLFVAGLFFFGLIVSREWGERLRIAFIVLGLRTDNNLLREGFMRIGLITRLGATGLGVIAFFYAALEATEAIGLAYRRRWAEYLVLLATVVFLPYEGYELVHHPRWTAALIFVVNLAIAAYLVKAKRLFHDHTTAEDWAVQPEVRGAPAEPPGVPAP